MIIKTFIDRNLNEFSVRKYSNLIFMLVLCNKIYKTVVPIMYNVLETAK